MARTTQAARRSKPQDEPDSDYTGDEDEIESQDGETQDEDTVSEEEQRRRDELEKAPMRAELKLLEKRWTKKGVGYFCEPQDDEEIPEQKTNWYEKFALCQTNVYDSRNQFVSSKHLSVNSPVLRQALRDVIGNFPGISFFTDKITLEFPPRCLYHYRDELQAHADELKEKEPQSEGAVHMAVLMDFINEHFADTIKEADNLGKEGLVNYELLWTIFRPGRLVYSTMLGQARAYKLNNYAYQANSCGEFFSLQCQYVDFDGDDFGIRHTPLVVWKMDGAVPIDALSSFPMQFHPSPEQATQELLERGRKWEAHAGQHFVHYRGVALDHEGGRFNIDSRTMIDCATHHRINGNLSFTVSPFQQPRFPQDRKKRKQNPSATDAELVPQELKKYTKLTDDQCVLASATVRGFAFSEKKFLDFFISCVSPIDWNRKCFEQLVLPDSQKELVQALVSEHTQRTTDPKTAAFDDIVKGKGRGLILVLHGPPGVGKTLTAECVAEFAERPLYIVSSGDLGTSASTLDEKLARTLDLASTWKAALLIDEADIYLERRSLHDVNRNSLVSIFLRTLEYYGGILFMTTNRIKTFDDAFKSRIHVPLRYSGLPASSRERIWRNFLTAGGDEVDIDDEGYRRLAEGELNGRQIKNVVRTARSLAAHKKRKLDQAQLQQVMDIQMAFERDMDGTDDDIDMVER
ncbi:hypothetical protein MAPG_09602 [Magnaporthiopsis poae ATCC 64411]|uniref:AAA+ ATPase domain-containing protein n=1 Tax=Magnaporthiopsis poae (strain ATCC 64411 / 73-15) TaxID=644358 RepID=A0A0C4EAD4_MAGP6|nr:hypothetical protein MAPG_09602 [Magnaporthiopsis poae ATCC 64411]